VRIADSGKEGLFTRFSFPAPVEKNHFKFLALFKRSSGICQEKRISISAILSKAS
jgi:hypothetical protein